MAQPKKTLQEVKAIVGEIQFMDRSFRVLEKGDGFLLQIVYLESDVETGLQEWQHARKWYVSSFSTKSEIVRTAYKACKTSMEHVVDEHFLYKGKRIYSPHYDVDALAELDSSRTDRRDR